MIKIGSMAAIFYGLEIIPITGTGEIKDARRRQAGRWEIQHMNHPISTLGSILS